MHSSTLPLTIHVILCTSPLLWSSISLISRPSWPLMRKETAAEEGEECYTLLNGRQEYKRTVPFQELISSILEDKGLLHLNWIFGGNRWMLLQIIGTRSKKNGLYKKAVKIFSRPSNLPPYHQWYQDSCLVGAQIAWSNSTESVSVNVRAPILPPWNDREWSWQMLGLFENSVPDLVPALFSRPHPPDMLMRPNLACRGHWTAIHHTAFKPRPWKAVNSLRVVCRVAFISRGNMRTANLTTNI